MLPFSHETPIKPRVRHALRTTHLEYKSQPSDPEWEDLESAAWTRW
jgi:hypothetical protein